MGLYQLYMFPLYKCDTAAYWVYINLYWHDCIVDTCHNHPSATLSPRKVLRLSRFFIFHHFLCEIHNIIWYYHCEKYKCKWVGMLFYMMSQSNWYPQRNNTCEVGRVEQHEKEEGCNMTEYWLKHSTEAAVHFYSKSYSS